MILKNMIKQHKLKLNKTGLQPVSRTCGTTPFGFQHCRRKKSYSLKKPSMSEIAPFMIQNGSEDCNI